MRSSILRRSALVVSMGVLCTLAASPAWAIPLQTLVELNLPVPSGDKLFTNFTAVVNPPGSIDISTIDVVAFQDPVTLDYGIRFQPIGTSGVIITAPVETVLDLLVGFDVAAAQPMLIHDIGMKIDGTVGAGGVVSVTETAPELVNIQLETVLPDKKVAHLDLPGAYPQLHIVKDILVWGGTSEPSSLYFIEQTFSQIPEPATVGLLVIGSLLVIPRLRRSHGPFFCLVAAMGVIALSTTNAKAIPLSDLDGSALTITNDDKVFSNFNVEVITNTGRTAYSPAAIDVAPIHIGSELGIRFAGAFAALGIVTAASDLKVQISFDVTVTDPTQLIDDITLRFNGARTGPDAFAKVTEQVMAPTGAPAGNAVVYNEASGLQLSNHAMLNGYFKTVHVIKTIEVFGGMTTGLASISYIDQTFSQVPEPMTVALLGIGGLFALRRRAH